MNTKGLVLFAFLAIVAFFLVTEHRAHLFGILPYLLVLACPLLHWLMHDEGFVGHTDEWWHFSWGDQMWAKMTGASAAHYGLASAG